MLKSLIIILLVLLFLLFIFHINQCHKTLNLENFSNSDQTHSVTKSPAELVVEGLRPSDQGNYSDIPIILICWNNLSFVQNFVEQLKKYPNPIILLDNNSNYPPMFDYYKQVETDKITVILLEQNHGHEVYKKLHADLPDVYFLSDPDLQLNSQMPQNFAEIFVKLSEKHKSYKVGAALDISDSEKFIPCDNYTENKSIVEWESQFWKKPISDPEYKLYDAYTDTTFCLVNTKYEGSVTNLRVAGDFTVKHLPWYTDYIKKNTPKDELEHWKKHNKSSSILWTCLQL
jgi:hypothetical protein